MSKFALVFVGTVAAAGAAAAQTQNSSTNCNVFGSTMNCNTTTRTTPGVNWDALNRQQQQNQQNMNQAFQNLGSAIAAARERSRQRKEAEVLQAQADAARAQQDAARAAEIAQQDAVQGAMRAAIERDNAEVPPPPPEKPVLLACKIGDYSTSLALYEKAGRVDVTEAGVTRARAASFTPDSVSWDGSVWHTAVSRIDMSLISTARLPQMSNAQVTGTCSLAERKF